MTQMLIRKDNRKREHSCARNKQSHACQRVKQGTSFKNLEKHGREIILNNFQYSKMYREKNQPFYFIFVLFFSGGPFIPEGNNTLKI